MNDTGTSGSISAETVPSGWQPIETAPKDGTPVLLAERTDLSNGAVNWYIDAGVNYYEMDPSNRDAWFEREGYEIVCDNPSHWMPLPEPPK